MPADLAEATRNRLNVQSRKRCIRCRIQDSHSRLSEHRERLRHVWQIDERDGLIANIFASSRRGDTRFAKDLECVSSALIG
jgi:predicted nucleotidyltransferase